MMKRIAALLVVMASSIGNNAIAQTYSLDWVVMSGGGGRVSDTGNRLLMSVGQNVVDVTSDAARVLRSGFLRHPRVLGSAFLVGVPISPGWNMVSNPVTVVNDSVRRVFPSSEFPYAFSFVTGGGYVQQYRMQNGRGYWAKFPNSQVQYIAGSARTYDSLIVSAGWNMVGSISFPVDTAGIVSVPAGIRSSLWFGYDLGYVAAEQIMPGRAYWVKVSAAGLFHLVSGPEPARPVQPSPGLEGTSTFTLTDASGQRQMLFIGTEAHIALPLEMYELPPAGPEGTLDVRFESQRMLELASDDAHAEYPVLIRSVAYPITLEWSINETMEGQFEVRDGLTGAMIAPQKISGTGQLTIANPSLSKLIITKTAGSFPAEFALSQNFPNPFNPSTNLRFSLPQQSHVRLAIYNLLGQEIAVLVDEDKAAGYHTIVWHGTNVHGNPVGSGVHFYRIEARPADGGSRFVTLRKMILMK